MDSAMFSLSERISDKFLVPRIFLRKRMEFERRRHLWPECGGREEASGPVVVLIVTDGRQRVGDLHHTPQSVIVTRDWHSYLVIDDRIYADCNLIELMIWRKEHTGNTLTESLVRISWGGTSKAPQISFKIIHFNLKPANNMNDELK